MDFQEADRRYADLRRRYENGDLSVEEFRAQHEQITVQDADGWLWAKHRDTGEWHYHDGSTWIPGTPPASPPIDDRNGRDNGESRSVAASERSSAARVVLWVLTILCAVLVIVTWVRGPGPGYFTVLFVVLAIIFGYLARRRG